MKDAEDKKARRAANEARLAAEQAAVREAEEKAAMQAKDKMEREQAAAAAAAEMEAAAAKLQAVKRGQTARAKAAGKREEAEKDGALSKVFDADDTVADGLEKAVTGHQISGNHTKVLHDSELHVKRKIARFYQKQDVDLLVDEGKLVLSFKVVAGFGDGVKDGAVIFGHVEAWKVDSKTRYEFSLITSDFGIFNCRCPTRKMFTAWTEQMEKHKDKLVDPAKIVKKKSSIGRTFSLMKKSSTKG